MLNNQWSRCVVLCVVVWALATEQGASAQDKEPAWSVGVGVGLPSMLEVSAAWHPGAGLYMGPRVAGILGTWWTVYEHRSESQDRPSLQQGDVLLGLAAGAVVGGAWPLWGAHGLSAEVNGGYVQPFGETGLDGGTSGSGPRWGWQAGLEAGWCLRGESTTWQVLAGITYLGWVLDDDTNGYFADGMLMPSLKVAARFDL
jgi:hypothetical protein